MALFPNALEQIRQNLELAAKGQKPRLIRVGVLSDAQLEKINSQRQEEDLDSIVAEVLFDGRHLYKSRCVEDGYSLDQVLEQIRSAFQDSSDVGPGWSTVLINRTPRLDHNGVMVHDEVVFMCHQRYPHPELYSAIPRGDGKDHLGKKKATR